jgi:hypothetical protein
VIGAVMLLGLGLTWPSARRQILIGFLTLAFGLLGTLVGMFTIVIGVGPQTTADIVYHVLLVTLLVVGIVIAWKAYRDSPDSDPAWT